MKEIVDALKKHMTNDTFYNEEKVRNGEINVIYIVGYSGSGKSTLSRTAKNFPNVEIVEHDLIDYVVHMTQKEIKDEGDLFYSFVKSHYNYCFDLYNIDKDYMEARRILHEKLNEYILKYSKEHKDKLFIIEGTRSLNSYVDKELPDIAIIIKNTPLITSYWRAIKRNALYKDPLRRDKTNDRLYTIRKFFKGIFNKSRWNYYRITRQYIKKIKEKIQP